MRDADRRHPAAAVHVVQVTANMFRHVFFAAALLCCSSSTTSSSSRGRGSLAAAAAASPSPSALLLVELAAMAPPVAAPPVVVAPPGAPAAREDPLRAGSGPKTCQFANGTRTPDAPLPKGYFGPEPCVFASDMVIRANDSDASAAAGALVWGSAAPGQSVVCALDGATVATVTADASGRWEVTLHQPASAVERWAPEFGDRKWVPFTFEIGRVRTGCLFCVENAQYLRTPFQ